jgi:hypothetical protein
MASTSTTPLPNMGSLSVWYPLHNTNPNLYKDYLGFGLTALFQSSKNNEYKWYTILMHPNAK